MGCIDYGVDFLKGKTVLVTGATGLIGSHIVDALMAAGNIRIFALSRNSKKLQYSFAQYLNHPNFQYIVQDISQSLELPQVPVDVIFHAAGSVSGSVIRSQPIDIIEPNVIGTHNLLEFLRVQKEETGLSGKFVFFSSATVYGGRISQDCRITEKETGQAEPLDSPHSPYAQSKRLSEVMTSAYYRQYGIDVLIVRFSYVYGYTLFPPTTAFFEFVQKAVSGEDICLNERNSPKRDNIYVEDAVSALFCVTERGISGEAYNISSGGELGNFAAMDEIAQMIANIVNTKQEKNVQVLCDTEPSGIREAGMIMDNAKLKSLNWELHTSLFSGIAMTVDQFQKYQETEES